MNDLKSLIDDHLDGVLTEDGYRQLADCLRASDEHIQEFVREWRLHSLLHDYISQRQVQADALLRAMSKPRTALWAEGLTPAALSKPSPLAAHSGANFMPRGLWRRAVAISSALFVIALCVGVVKYVVLPPTVAAMITQTANCRWADVGEQLSDGALVREGDELRLLDGRVLITFSSGAQIVLQGPAVLSVHSDMSAALTAGRLSAKVPLQAVGFVVHTPLAQLADLGTEFSAIIHADNSLELQVFTGMVEVTVESEVRQDQAAPLRISEGVAVIIDDRSRVVRQVDYDPNRRVALP